MNLEDVVLLYACGTGCGLILSSIPFILGEIIHLGFAIMKKGG